ncbi:outer membrane beta-barrel protein [Kaarinaea lacus]
MATVIRLVFAVVTVLIFPIYARATGAQVTSEQYVGGGIGRFSINSDHPSVDDQAIFGISLLYGIRRHNHVFELSMGGGSGLDVGPIADPFYPADSADYGYFSLSYQYQFRNLLPSENITPYFGGGYSFNSINWQNYVYDVSGDGYSIIAGMIFQVQTQWSVNLAIRRMSFSGERILFVTTDYPDYDNVVYEFAANLVYHFSISRN